MTTHASDQTPALDPAQRRLLETLRRPAPNPCPYCAADPEHAHTHATGEHGTIHPDAIAVIAKALQDKEAQAAGAAANAKQRTDADILFDR